MLRSVPLLAAAVIAMAATALLPGTADASTPEPRPECTPNDVDVVMRLVENSADAGYGYLQISAPGGVSCSLTGFLEEVEFLDEGHAPIPTGVHHDVGLPIEAVDPSEWEHVEVGLAWTDDPSAPAFAVPSFLSFRLPGSTETVVVDWLGGPLDADSLYLQPVFPPVS